MMTMMIMMIMSELRNPEFRNSQTYKMLLANLPNFCLRGREYLYYSHQETIFPSPYKETLSLASEIYTFLKG